MSEGLCLCVSVQVCDRCYTILSYLHSQRAVTLFTFPSSTPVTDKNSNVTLYKQAPRLFDRGHDTLRESHLAESN